MTKFANQLTPAERLLIRWARLKGLSIKQIASDRRVSKDVVIAHTTMRQVVPATSAAEVDEQESHLRRLFGEELGVEFESEGGQKVFSYIFGQLVARATGRTVSWPTSPDQENSTSGEIRSDGG